MTAHELPRVVNAALAGRRACFLDYPGSDALGGPAPARTGGSLVLEDEVLMAESP